MRVRINEHVHKFEAAKAQLTSAREEFVDAEIYLERAEEAQLVIQDVTQEIQNQVHAKFSGIVTRCLEVVFDDPYEFDIRFERRRGKVEADLVFIRGGLELSDPMREVGGGVIDVASFALRLACLMIAKPPVRKLLVLDEPFSRIRGLENRQRVRDLVVDLADELGVQIIMNIDVDAYPEFELGKVVQL